jgi:G3E family GTPase
LPEVRLLRAAHANVPRELIVGLGRKTGRRHQPAVASRLDHGGRDHDHGEVFEAWCWTCEAPLDRTRLEAALRSLPAKLLRAKGILRLAGEPAAAMFQLVGRRRSLDTVAAAPPERSEFVALGLKGSIDPDALATAFEAAKVAG